MKKYNFKEGDLIEVTTSTEKSQGILMQSPSQNLVIKLNNGYNLSINKNDIKSIKLLQKYKQQKEKKVSQIKFNKNLPTISILHTGGTIASKVDYKTGAVSAKFSPQDLLQIFPELQNTANIKSKLIFQIFSEDMEPKHWIILAKEILKEIKNKINGIIITHGTDTLAYTSAALSFMLQDLNIPILLVGAQRSSDRGSSDAALNLICATHFITKTNFTGVAVCMHSSIEDNYCYIHPGTKVKKLHSSRRDAFKTINDKPYAKAYPDGKIEYLRDYPKKDSSKKLDIKIGFDQKVAILKARPGLNIKELEFYEKNKYKGLILEGTGLGHLPLYTLKILQRMNKKGIFLVMTPQTIFGHINLNVYSRGRELQNVGIISGEDMLAETAYVKLGWLLANYPKNQIRKLITENLCGEINKRILPDEYIEE
jgi:glutamyl-tRNA(Gln) amidotransferase subunit D